MVERLTTQSGYDFHLRVVASLATKFYNGALIGTST